MSSSKTSSRSASDPERLRGVIQRIYPERGFGFIRCPDRIGSDGRAVEFFFHATGLSCRIDQLQEGEPVEFEVRETPKGLRAESVQRLP